MGRYKKPMYTLASFASDGSRLARTVPGILKAVVSKTLPADFREKIMLAETGVNDCRYCAFVHAHWARCAGVETETIKALLRGDLYAGLPEEEISAVEFARHFARSGGQPDEQRIQELIAMYGQPKAEAIQAFLRMIYVANLAGNTFDALLARLTGLTPDKGQLGFELLFSSVAAPILLPVLLLIALRRHVLPDPEELMQAIPV